MRSMSETRNMLKYLRTDHRAESRIVRSRVRKWVWVASLNDGGILCNGVVTWAVPDGLLHGGVDIGIVTHRRVDVAVAHEPLEHLGGDAASVVAAEAATA
jgi:hypothetical protein